MKLIKGVIFDIDGCLIDSESVYLKCWAEGFRREGIPVDQEMVNSWAGAGRVEIDRDVLAVTGDPKTAKRLRAYRESIFLEMLEAGQVEIKPGAREILDYLKEIRMPIGVASSGTRDKAERLLKYFGLLGYFDQTAFGDEVRDRKPAPDLFQLALRRLGISPDEAIVFEDSKNGVLSALAAGIERVVHVPDSSVKGASNEDLPAWKRIVDLNEGIKLIDSELS